MERTGIFFKNTILHILFAFILTFAFNWYGAVFVAGFFVGAEFMQVCYRSFANGFRWDDLYKNLFILMRYLHIKDTAIDLLTYVIGIIVGMLCR